MVLEAEGTYFRVGFAVRASEDRADRAHAF